MLVQDSPAPLHTTLVNGLPLRTGDLIFTQDAGGEPLPGQFWLILGRLIPGEVDHVAIYVGPEGRCVEAGARGQVSSFDIGGERWDGEAMLAQRGMVDRICGIADPLAGRGIPPEREPEIRRGVADYCLAQIGKPYNLNFFDADQEQAFYGSQLVYKAYLRYGIDFNLGQGVPGIASTRAIIFPQEVWEACAMRARL